LPNGSYISDLGINFYRVSSTREIIKQREKSTYESAVLYGGLKYNADIKDLIASDAEERSNGLRGIGGLKDDVENDLRQGNILWKYLIGTKIEVSEIEKIASNFGVNTKLFSESNGTESTFKNMSGKMIDIIHIATHGFYIKPINNKTGNNQMERSGLAFAGANHVQSGAVLPEGVDDGILTAEEILRLDFRSIDLIVLSACETGLGDITGEGVFGLQRGFKKAGVNSILMSLWKVDDDATQTLMVEFYKNFLNGETKAKSLLKAQRYVRSQPGWEDPEYWAGFILLDALN
jgi:CHAT domain-containing protein